MPVYKPRQEQAAYSPALWVLGSESVMCRSGNGEGKGNGNYIES